MTEKEMFITMWTMIFQWGFIASLTSNDLVRMVVWILGGFIYGYINGWVHFQHA